MRPERETSMRLHSTTAVLLGITLLLAPMSSAQEASEGTLDARARAALGITADDSLSPQLPTPVPNAASVPWMHGPIRYDGSGNIATIGT
jgi:hypothetical protein